MLKEKKDAAFEFISKIDLLYVYFLIATLMEGWLMITDDRTFNFHKSFIIIPCLLFLGTALTRKKTLSAKYALLSCCAVCVWFVIIQTQHNYSWTSMLPIGLFFSVYLLAYPFASVAQDGEKQVGLKMFAWIYIAASMVLVICAALLIAGKLPGSLASYVYWDGGRLTVFWHPNTCSCIFMIGIAFCLCFLSQTNRTWLKGLLLLLIAAQFCASALTNCRTSILMTCALIGGFVFFLINKGGWKHFLAGIIAALTILFVLFPSAGSLYRLNYNRLLTLITTQTVTEPTEVSGIKSEASHFVVPHSSVLAPSTIELSNTTSVISVVPLSASSNTNSLNVDAPITEPTTEPSQVKLSGNNGQGSFLHDLRTFNGRISIWNAAFSAIQNQPSLLLWGAAHPGQTISEYFGRYVEHAHNSWIEILLSIGLPGLLFALYFTWIASKGAFIILFCKKYNLLKKCIAMLALCLLMAGSMEPFLFISNCYYHFIDYAFFFCTGYIYHWTHSSI